MPNHRDRSAPKELAATPLTTLKRGSERGCFEIQTIHNVLDEGLVCNVSFVIDGRPLSIPMAYARVGDQLLLHGSTANRMMRNLRDGGEACISVTMLDGLVLARSAFHHSVNFRSVVIYGQAREIVDPDDKLAALRATIEHVVPGRWNDVRPPNAEEFARTMILSVAIAEASAKLRSGTPIDDPEDYRLDTWAGEIPLRQVAMQPLSDPLLPDAIEAPDYATNYHRPV